MRTFVRSIYINILKPITSQYAYKVPDDQGYTPPTLSHAQSAPRAFQHFQPQNRQPRAHISQPTNGHVIPSSSRFKPPGPPSSSRNNLIGHHNRPPANMGPPPPPLRHIRQTTNVTGSASKSAYVPPASRHQISVPSTSSGHHPATSASTPQRFFPNGILPSNSRTNAARLNSNSIP